MQEFNFDAFESYAKIVVIGVGGAGNNAVNQMIEDSIKSIDFWVVNTDAQALATSKAEHKYVLGKDYTRGLGAGGNPEIGRKAAEASIDDLKEIVKGANMVFIAAGMGGGTGTGASPIIAKIAKESGALTIAIVTRPFGFEGNSRKAKAVEGLSELKKEVDSIIIVSNDKLMMMNGNKSIAEAFSESDKVLAQSVKTITDLILLPGLINLDFADIKATLIDKGVALIGFGMGTGPNKAVEAATNAIASPLLEASIKGAHSAIINVTGGNGVTLDETQEAITYITEAAGSNVNIIFGVQQNGELNDQMLISVIATDFDSEYVPEEETTQIKKIIREVEPVTPKKEEVVNNETDSILPNFLQELVSETPKANTEVKEQTAESNTDNHYEEHVEKNNEQNNTYQQQENTNQASYSNQQQNSYNQYNNSYSNNSYNSASSNSADVNNTYGNSVNNDSQVNSTNSNESYSNNSYSNNSYSNQSSNESYSNNNSYNNQQNNISSYESSEYAQEEEEDYRPSFDNSYSNNVDNNEEKEQQKEIPTESLFGDDENNNDNNDNSNNSGYNPFRF